MKSCTVKSIALVIVLPMLLQGCLAVSALFTAGGFIFGGPVQYASMAYTVGEYSYEYLVNGNGPDVVIARKLAFLTGGDEPASPKHGLEGSPMSHATHVNHMVSSQPHIVLANFDYDETVPDSSMTARLERQTANFEDVESPALQQQKHAVNKQTAATTSSRRPKLTMKPIYSKPSRDPTPEQTVAESILAEVLTPQPPTRIPYPEPRFSPPSQISASARMARAGEKMKTAMLKAQPSLKVAITPPDHFGHSSIAPTDNSVLVPVPENTHNNRVLNGGSAIRHPLMQRAPRGN